MNKKQSRMKYSFTAILFIIAIVFAITGAASAQPDVGPAADRVQGQVPDPSLMDDVCRLRIQIEGDGSVSAQGKNGDAQMLQAGDELQVSCGEGVELTAQPGANQRFVRWLGVSEDIQLKSRITVDSPANITAVFAELELLGFEQLDTPYVDRGGQLVTELPIYKPGWRSVLEVGETNAVPEIDVWYGTPQKFGQNGNPQRWVNIVGNVIDPDGTLPELEYMLNGGTPRSLNVGGPHLGEAYRLRLYRDGDFNIDINKDDLLDGANTVVITASDTLSETTSTVTVNYSAGEVWDLPTEIKWSKASSIQNVAQVVDGDWELTGAGVRPKTGQTGYDRIIAVGDLAWQDFEAEVDITVDGYSEEGFGGKQVVPAIGLVMRWEGHTTTPDLCDQPLCGYLPVGATSWYAFKSKTSPDGQFSLWVKPSGKVEDPSGYTLNWGETYTWKVRAESVPGTRGVFKMKVWPAGDSEPTDWLITMPGTGNSLQNGSLLLLSHHVDVTFGDVKVSEVTPGEGPPAITNWEVIFEPHGATVRWLTDEPATSKVKYGTSMAYGDSVQAPVTELVMEHSLYLPDLDPNTTYHYQILSKDADDQTGMTEEDLTFKTQELISLVSDDFNTCELDPAWEFINPLDDGTLALTGYQVAISVPEGADHDIWPSPDKPTNRAPRLMRAVTEPHNLKVKFDSGVTLDRQLQGLLLEDGDKRFMRVNYQYQGGKVKLYAIGYTGTSSPVILKSLTLTGDDAVAPHYLWLRRQDGQWLVSYSSDDENWSDMELFTYPLSVTKAGVFSGNYNKTDGSEPAHTAIIDYYFDAANPIDPQDTEPLNLPITIVGNGSVTKDPTCGSPVTLYATADPGWHFVEWQGSPVDGLTALQVEAFFEEGDEVTALFEIGEPTKYTLAVQTNGQGSVSQEPEKTQYISGEVVTLTAEPDDGWLFEDWGGAISGTNPVKIFVMDADKTVTANFKRASFGLNVTIDGPGQVQVSPQGPYDFGEEVTLTAIPAVGAIASFGGWSGDIESSDNPLTIEMNGDVAITATFITYQQFMPMLIRP